MPLNKPSPRLAILRAQLAAEADAILIQRASYKISNAVGCSCPVPAPDADSLPLPPSYWDDLEHWLKTLAPAKPAAPEAPFPAPPQLPPVPGLALADLHAHIRDRLASTSSAADGAALIGAKPAVPAQQPAQKASAHIVCVKSYVSQASISFHVGQVVGMTMADVLRAGKSEYWRPCDESGWVTHAPTADAVCPVPRGVRFSVRMRDGQESAPGTLPLSWGPACDGTIIAWRPIAQS